MAHADRKNPSRDGHGREERVTIGCTTSRRVVVFEVEDRSRRPRDPCRYPIEVHSTPQVASGLTGFYRHITLLAAIAVLSLSACDDQRSLPKSMQLSAEQFDAKLAEYADKTGPPLVKVVSADDGEPVPNILVGMILIGPDGGDGGYQQFLTGPDGIADRWLNLAPGRYQYHMRAGPGGRFVHTEWRRGDTYIRIDTSGNTLNSSGEPILPTITIQTGG